MTPGSISRTVRRLLIPAFGLLLSFLLPSGLRAQLNMNVTFPGPGLPPGVTASGAWVAVPSESVVRVPAAPGAGTREGVFDLGELGAGRAMGATDIEAWFIRRGTSGAVSSAIAVPLVQPSVPVSAPNQIAGSSAAFCRLTETNGQATIKLLPDAQVPGPGFAIPAAVLNRNGQLLKLRLK